MKTKISPASTCSLLILALVLALLLTAVAGAEPSKAGDKANEVVNINTASAAELAFLPRVGPALAAKILEFREANGEFKQPEDLMLVRGIGEKTFQLMEPYVVVTGKTTLARKIRASELPSATGTTTEIEK